MDSQMENTSPICIQLLINNITSYLSGNNCKNTSVVKVNNEKLAINGELYFIPSLKVWKNLLKDTDKCEEKCTTILQHFLYVRGGGTNNNTDADIANQVKYNKKYHHKGKKHNLAIKLKDIFAGFTVVNIIE